MDTYVHGVIDNWEICIQGFCSLKPFLTNLMLCWELISYRILGVLTYSDKEKATSTQL